MLSKENILIGHSLHRDLCGKVWFLFCVWSIWCINRMCTLCLLEHASFLF